MAANSTKPEGYFLQSIQHNNNTISKEEELTYGGKGVKENTSNIIKNDISNKSNSNDESNLLIPANSEKVVTKSCNCTNISIMHLFHEMKQNFPTIPDTIVAEYVSDNCHQRENCIKQLRKEVELKPVPTQTYPAKIVHPPHTNTINNLPSVPKATLQQQNQIRMKPLTKILKPIRPAPPQPTSANQTIDIKQRDQSNTEITSYQSAEIMLPGVNNKSQAELGQNCPNISRARPTTLNLKNVPQQLQQQRHLLNIQLQQRLQHNQERIIKPLRKAPLPPVGALKLNTTPVQGHSTSNNSTSTNLANHLPEAEISVNLSLSTTTPTLPSLQHCVPTSQLQSPKRHRSVITLQPEPPYTRDFLISASTTTRPIHTSPIQVQDVGKSVEEGEAGVPTSGTKSFTSVNLTLRQPTLSNGQSSQQRPSTIDISAGPGLAGIAGTGFSYSSSSYDARQGYRKNFHITVTDEGGVISASRINQKQGELENVLHQQQQQQQQHYLLKQQKQQQNMNKQSLTSCLEQISHTERDNETIALVIKRQKGQCDKLRLALNENKKRLQRVNKEINVIKEPIRYDVKEQLALDIKKLCEDCESIVDEIENMRRCSTISQHNRTHYTMQQMESFPQENSTSTIPQDHQHQQSPIFPVSSNFIQSGEQITTSQYQHRNVNNEEIYDSDDFVSGGFTSSARNNTRNVVIDDNDDIAPEFWECKLCTFHNYPDLNMCECCNVVRILPGTLSNFNLPRVANANPATANFLNNNSHGQLNSHIEHDTNCLSQHFALHT